MEKPKILIEIRGGTIVNIVSSTDATIGIVDYDGLQNGEPIQVSTVSPNQILPNPIDALDKGDKDEKEAQKQLIKLWFHKK